MWWFPFISQLLELKLAAALISASCYIQLNVVGWFCGFNPSLETVKHHVLSAYQLLPTTGFWVSSIYRQYSPTVDSSTKHYHLSFITPSTTMEQRSIERINLTFWCISHNRLSAILHSWFEHWRYFCTIHQKRKWPSLLVRRLTNRYNTCRTGLRLKCRMHDEDSDEGFPNFAMKFHWTRDFNTSSFVDKRRRSYFRSITRNNRHNHTYFSDLAPSAVIFQMFVYPLTNPGPSSKPEMVSSSCKQVALGWIPIQITRAYS